MAAAVMAVRRIGREFRTVSDVTLFVRMVGWSVALRGLKHVMPLPALVRLVHRRPVARRELPRDADERITTFARWACAAARLSREGNCLERGLVTYRYLSGFDRAPSLVVGACFDQPDEVLRGHAWVQLGGRVVGEAPSAVERFTPVMSFDARGRLTSSDGRPSGPGSQESI
jgi:hypothetical protein